VTKTQARSAAEAALLDAAERLLVDVGYAGITTRRLAEEAGVNHGLVHYYFGSIENLLVRTLERFTERLVARQRQRRDHGIDMPLEALVSLVMTFNLGIMLERLGAIDRGHRELLKWIEGRLDADR
jgi:AcrR family transcriptional regulator